MSRGLGVKEYNTEEIHRKKKKLWRINRKLLTIGKSKVLQIPRRRRGGGEHHSP